MAAEKSPEGREIIQELEPVDVVRLDQLLVARSAAQEDRKNLQSKHTKVIPSLTLHKQARAHCML